MKIVRKFEIKPCQECGSEYKHYDGRSVGNKCTKCKQKEYYLKHGRMSEEEKKKRHPIHSETARRRHYTKLRKEFDKCKTREQKTAFYDKRIEDMIQSGVWLWCIDLRIQDKSKPRKSNRGRMKNEEKDVRKKYPDTRVMNE